MRCNEGLADRIARISLSLVPLALGVFAPFSVAVRIILLIVGGYLLFSGLTGFCLIYALLHFSTNR